VHWRRIERLPAGVALSRRVSVDVAAADRGNRAPELVFVFGVEHSDHSVRPILSSHWRSKSVTAATYPQRGPGAPRTPSAVLPTTSCTVIEFAGWNLPQRTSR